jgi:hypothetical protein
MATTQEFHAPTLGAQGEPCASCGAPLAGDQRYCLECGARRSEARLPFRDILAGGAAAPSGAPPPATAVAVEERPAPRGSGPTFLIGLLCLLVALGVGVLIGNAGDDKTASTPPPQVITVGGAAAAPAATAPAASTPTTTDASGADSSSSGGSSSGSSKGSGSSSSSSKSTGSKADKKNVQALDNSTGSDYQKKSQKLPKEVGTSGAPAKKDNKPAGGGSATETIG